MTNSMSVPTSLQRVTATATSHAGEVLQGAVRTGEGTRRVLLSLPAPTLWSRAEVICTPGIPLSVEPRWMTKARRAVSVLLKTIQEPAPEIRVSLTTNIPVGKGCGSSTTDVLATMQALLRYFHVPMTEERLARLVVAVEEATDGSVLSQPTVFRHREGMVHEYLDAAFPPMEIIVVDTEPCRTINTVSMLRARYSATELKTFELMIDRAKRAFRSHDPVELGSVATESARISQRFLPKPYLEDLIELTARLGGYGVAVSHSGTVASLMMPSGLGREQRGQLIRSVKALGMDCVTEYFLGATGVRVIAA